VKQYENLEAELEELVKQGDPFVTSGAEDSKVLAIARESRLHAPETQARLPIDLFNNDTCLELMFIFF